MELYCILCLPFSPSAEKNKIKTDTVKSTKKNKCVGTSKIGTSNGYPITVGNKTVKIGITKTKFDRRLLKNNKKSLDLTITTSASKNNADSNATFNLLVIDIMGKGAGIKTNVSRIGQKS